MWHNTFPADLVPSLTDARFSQEQWEHRLQGLVAPDLKSFQTRIQEVASQDELGSGVDWRTLIHVVVDRYAERLEILQYLLNTTSATEHVRQIQRQLRTMLVLYILYTSTCTSTLPCSTYSRWTPGSPGGFGGLQLESTRIPQK